MAGSGITRRSFVSAAVAAAGLGLAACGSAQSQAQSTSSTAAGPTPTAKTLTVFAAASLTESLTEAGELFKAANDGVGISFNFDSSGTLKTQIQEGADCDVFISAGQKQMNQLDAGAASGNSDGLDLINHDTRFDILENKVTLCVPEGNPKAIQGFDDMVQKLRAHDILLGMGNSDVPVGQYTQKILAYYNLDETELAGAGCITYGTNVKEVTSQVFEAAVDCGVIYKTDATSANLTMVDEATEEMCGRVVYPAAAIKNAPQPELAASFLDFLKTKDAGDCFEKVGFTPLAEA
ncbi:MAG: molybdate ABC transporter substrate-binding protein [Tractidigestivibacter sp.]|uniref:molybdate ABC transporter substrate-binding protein n=1 Tax=Tractidigestivibacter sp. TaxID=2847320 RepID=UPI002A80BD8D|nr:molybdate ABC transporter substrate-binding protein [Tractidigestivibacter sp.]MDY4534257.1 molybdate ABC transporter substrate-binding protein [Tractidigestivibacter sp.]